jgi:hypothetical protein
VRQGLVAVAAVVALLVLVAVLAWAGSPPGGHSGSPAAPDSTASSRPPEVGVQGEALAPPSASTTTTVGASPSTSVSPPPSSGLPAPAPPTSAPSTTASTATPSTTTSTTAVPVEQRLLVSWQADRSEPLPLDGATLSGVVHVFWDDQAQPPSSGSVSFWIDDPDRVGAPASVELVSPFDLAATAPGGEAYGWDVDALAPGVHTVTALAGPGQLATATFEVV